jgi:hemimethylated DNA binding protein
MTSLAGTDVEKHRIMAAAAAIHVALLTPAYLPSSLPRPRCAPVVCLAPDGRLPSATTRLAPLDVVQSMLEALHHGEVRSCFDFASTSMRRVTGPRNRFEKVVRESPEYKPLVENSRYEILSALQLAPGRWQCRVKVDNTVGRTPFSVEYRCHLIQHMDGHVIYDLGQCVTHKESGYRGVVVGWDRECKQGDEWCKRTGVDELSKGRVQPFYHVLVDMRDQPEPQMSYVAQESLEAADVHDIEHPYFGRATFTGETKDGRWVPSQALREQYPLGLEGCWLVDYVFPDRQASDGEYHA